MIFLGRHVISPPDSKWRALTRMVVFTPQLFLRRTYQEPWTFTSNRDVEVLWRPPRASQSWGYQAELVKAAETHRWGPPMPSSKAKFHPEDNFPSTCARLEEFGSPQVVPTTRLICCNVIKQRNNRFFLVLVSHRAEVKILALYFPSKIISKHTVHWSGGSLLAHAPIDSGLNQGEFG